MAFTIGQYGLSSLGRLAGLVGTFYLTSALFVIVVLGTVAKLAGFSILRFIAYIKDELLIVLGTSSSETVLPQIMAEDGRPRRAQIGRRPGRPDRLQLQPRRHQHLHDAWRRCSSRRPSASTSASANTRPSSLVAMLTSKGASGVTGAGFITLAATLAAIPNNPVPVAAMTLVLGIDKFMSECRALTNLVGNGVACVVVSAWEGELDRAKLNAALAHPGASSAIIEAKSLDQVI